LPKAETWGLLSKRWFQIASGVFLIDLAILAFLGAIYTNLNPFFYASGVLLVPGTLIILGAIIRLIADNSRTDDKSIPREKEVSGK